MTSKKQLENNVDQATHLRVVFMRLREKAASLETDSELLSYIVLMSGNIYEHAHLRLLKWLTL